MIDLDLTDRTSVSVNPASGNVAITTRELSIQGTGLDLNVAHTSNSVGDTARLGLIGHAWTSSLDARLDPDRTLMFVDGGGAQSLFPPCCRAHWTARTA